MFHYKLASPKAAAGVINFAFQATINGIRTEWNANTQTGVLNIQMPAEPSGWTLATVDLRALFSHWQRETGHTGPMNLQTVHIGPGAIDTVARQYWGVVYFRGFRMGSASLKLGLVSAILEGASFTDGAEAWIPQGESISFTPLENGEVFLVKKLSRASPGSGLVVGVQVE